MGCAKAGDAEHCAQDRQSSQVMNLDAEEEAMLAHLTSTSQPFYHQTPSRRPRPDTDSDEEDAEAKRQRTTIASITQAAKYVPARSAPASETYVSDMEEDECNQPHAEAHGTKAASPTYADTMKATASGQPAAVNPRDGTSGSPPHNQTTGKSPPKARYYPPLIVDSMPNWAHHFRILKKPLGRAPNAARSVRA